MTNTLTIRILITVLAATQAMISTALAFSDQLPNGVKIGLVVASAGLAVVLNQIPSWNNAGVAADTMKAAGAKAD